MNRKLWKISFVAITAMIFLACSKSDNTAPNNTTSGPLFTAVKAIITANCVGCHSGANINGGMDLGTDAKIVTAQVRVKARAVTIGDMPQGGSLSAAEKQAISNWINAGGRATD